MRGFTRFAVEVPRFENKLACSMERCGEKRPCTELLPFTMRSVMVRAATYEPVMPHLLNPVAT